MKVTIDCKGGKTRQEMKKECDVNNIMRRYKKTGKLPDMIKLNPKFGDFAKVTDYHESLNLIIKAENQFNCLSAEIRKRFNNDPAEMLNAINNMDESNIEEFTKLGIIKPKPPVAGGEEKKPVPPAVNK